MRTNFKIILLLILISSLSLYAEVALAGGAQGIESYKVKIIESGKMKDFDRALSLLNEMKQKFPEERQFQASLHYDIAHGYYKVGNINKAWDVIQRAFSDYSSESRIRAFYARLLIKRGRTKKALEILDEFPHIVEIFEEDLREKALDIWTAYDLAASYSLLKKNTLAVLYLNALFSVEDFNTKLTFSHVIADPDFDSIRQDQRYTFIVGMVFADDFNDVIINLEKELGKAIEVNRNFFRNKTGLAESLRQLNQGKQNIDEIYTVAPMLIEIQSHALDFVDSALETISAKEDQRLPLESLEEEYGGIIDMLTTAKSSQRIP